jgi:hypothetical protein
MTAIIKPPPLRAAVPGGFTLDDFTIDSTTGTVTCPENITVEITRARRANFGARCDNCAVRYLCTTAGHGRAITVHPHRDLLAAARAQACTGEFQTTYQQHRPMIERTIAWLVRGARRLRYRGTDRNRLWWSHRCAAINLQRLINLGLTHQTTWAIT